MGRVLGVRVRAAFLAALAAAAAALATPSHAQERERWQLTFSDGSYLYELRPVGLRGDSLVIEREGTTEVLALERIDELRRVQKSLKGVGSPRATFGGLIGADDDVFRLAYLDLPERCRIVREILAARRAEQGSTAARSTSP